MFWKRKPKQALILKTYLIAAMPLVSQRQLSNPGAKAGLQVFILGMADMFRQAEKLSWEEFVTIYESALAEFALLPSTPVSSFIDSIGRVASKNADVEKLMRYGAQSIKMWVAEHDANAPTDLISAAMFAEKNVASFSGLDGS